MFAGLPGRPATWARPTPPAQVPSERKLEGQMDGQLQGPQDGQVVTGRYRGALGERAWRLYIPAGYNRARPPMLLVLLHGCTQNADDLARGSQMDRVADERGFLVLYPEQSVQANPRTCWNWFDAAHQSRDAGETGLLAALIAEVMSQYPVDTKRVHLAGISAGAAMAGLVAVAYPERFASLTSASGVAWRSATTVGAALAVMQRGAGEKLATAQDVVGAMGATRRALPVLVVHGTRDAVVSPANADETTQQWIGVHQLLRASAGLPALKSAADESETVNGYAVRTSRWREPSGTVLIEQVRIEGLGHAWSGGSTAGTFSDAQGPDASRMIAAFCALHRLP
ncbi:MAG: PHB depolymerase family esterase [Gemmatimonadaceae bacterium]|nr:PHB depolymerase family esterase [Gemmatimonadaceae bacterium]